MVHYSSEVLLKEVCDSEAGHNLPTILVEITATVLDQEVSPYCVFIRPTCYALTLIRLFVLKFIHSSYTLLGALL